MNESRNQDVGLLFLRVSGALFLCWVHGMPKLLNYSEQLKLIEDPFHLGAHVTLLLAIGAEVLCPLLIIAGVLVRLAWRLYAGAPRPVPGTPGWQHATAVVTHVLLYAIMFAMPLSGWLYDSASGLRPFKLFGLLEMPKLVAPDEAIAATAHELHEWGLYVLIVLVVVHAGAALYHHLFLGDATLTRMLPRGWLRASAPAAPGKES